jgi:ABC-type branched-subunit amino acid transport system permease subunit
MSEGVLVTGVNWLVSLVGLMILGEAVVLLVGGYVLGHLAPSWRTHSNVLLLFLDGVVGAGLIYAVWMATPLLIVLLAILGVLSHAYRLWEVVTGRLEPFAANHALSIMNTLKLTLLVFVFIELWRY